MERKFRLFNGVLVKATCAALALWMVGTLSSSIAYAQRDSDRYAIDQCQDAVRQKMASDMRGSDPQVQFDRPIVSRTSVGTRCSGSGVFMRDDQDRGRRFNYAVNLRFGNVEDVNYRFSGSGGSNNYRPGGNSYDRRDEGGNYVRPGVTGRRPEGRTSFSGPIINLESGKALDVENRGGGTFSGSNVQQWEYANQRNQNWELVDLGNNEVAIVSQSSGMVLNAEGRANSGNVDQTTWTGSPSQRWRLERRGGSTLIVSVGSGRCLDVAGHSRENGANVQQYDCHGEGNQQWRLGR
jgi:hypothetical protein